MASINLSILHFVGQNHMQNFRRSCTIESEKCGQVTLRSQITQDLDFSNPFVFDPLPTKGIVVLRNPSQLLHDLRGLVKEMISLLPKESPTGHLWVVTKGRIRIWPA